MTEPQEQVKQPEELIDNLQSFVEQRCSQVKALMQQPSLSERQKVQKYTNLVKDVLEHATGSVSKDSAVEMLRSQLEDLGSVEKKGDLKSILVSAEDDMGVKEPEEIKDVIEDQLTKEDSFGLKFEMRSNARASDRAAERVTMAPIDKQEASMVGSIDSFHKQLIQCKKDLVGNRKTLSNVMSDVTKFRSDMVEMLAKSQVDMDANTAKFLECAQGNVFLHSGHMAHDLNLCETRHTFGNPNPVLLAHLSNSMSLVSGAGSSVDVVKIIPGKGFQVIQNLNTEGNEVFAACLIDGAQHGISMKPMFEDESKTKDILILGCDKGIVFKFEKPKGNDSAPWEMKQKEAFASRVKDVLQTKEHMILVCQEDSKFDFVTIDNLNRATHIDGLKEIKDGNKARLLLRGGQIAVADETGLVFLEHKAAGANVWSLTAISEKYLKGKNVIDFVEYEIGEFLVTCTNDSNFYLVNRDKKTTTPIASLNANYITMGIQMLPKYEIQYAIVRDLRGIQLLNLVTMKSHQLFLTPYETEWLDTRYLQVYFDEATQCYAIVSIVKDAPSDEDDDLAKQLVKPQLVLYTFRPEFTHALKSLNDNMYQSRIKIQ